MCLMTWLSLVLVVELATAALPALAFTKLHTEPVSEQQHEHTLHTLKKQSLYDGTTTQGE